MGLFGIRNEKLGAICIGSIICHRHYSSYIVLYEWKDYNNTINFWQLFWDIGLGLHKADAYF